MTEVDEPQRIVNNMPLVAYLCTQHSTSLEALKTQLIDVNQLPNVDQNVDTFLDKHVCIVSLSTSVKQRLYVTLRHVIAIEGEDRKSVV